MASSILLDLLNETETPLNLPKPKHVPSRKVSTIDKSHHHHEGWHNKQKYVDSHTSIAEDLNFSFSSQDSWDTSENNHNIFKNALANLSEGLAIMHKKGKPTKKDPIVEEKKSQPKTCTSIKPERKVQSRQIKRHRPTASLGSLDKGTTGNDNLGQTETGKPFRRHKDTLDSSRESLPQTYNTMPPELKALTEAKGILGFLQVSKDYAPKVAKPLKLDRTNDLIGFKASKEVNICEFVLKSAKPENLGPRMFPMNSYNQQVPLTLEKSGHNMHNALMKQGKPTRTVRTVSLSSIDEQKDPGHWVSLEQGFSPRNALNKTEYSSTGQQANRNVPFLKQQKRILVRRGPSPIERTGAGGENSRAVTPTSGAVRTTVIVKSRERVSSAVPTGGYQTAPNPIINRRNSHGDAVEANKDGTLRSILGQVFVNEVRKPPRNPGVVAAIEKNNNRHSGAPGFMNKSCFTSDENAKDPVEFILSLYKSGAEKSLEKAKIGTRNERVEGGFKVMDCLKRTAEYNRQKNIQRVGDFSLGDSNILKERISKQRDVSALKSNKNELGVEISINHKKHDRKQGYSDKLKLIL